MRLHRWRGRAGAALVAGTLLPLAMSAPSASAGTPAQLADGQPASASSARDGHGAAEVTDGDSGTYWESTAKATDGAPQWIRTDLGATVRVGKVVLALPGGDKAQKQTLKLQGSTNGRDFTDLTDAKARTFRDTGKGTDAERTYTADLGGAATRHVRVLITAGPGNKTARLSGLEVYADRHGDATAPTTPENLKQSASESGTALDWTAAQDAKGVTAYDVFADGRLRTSVAGDVTSYTDPQRSDEPVSYTVRARDAMGNQSPDSNSVTRKPAGPFRTSDAASTPSAARADRAPVAAKGPGAPSAPGTSAADDAVAEEKERQKKSGKAAAGEGATMPYSQLEAEDGELGGEAAVVGPNRTIGDVAGEASGRRAVTLEATGDSVEFTTDRATNTLVTRFSVPDAEGGGGIDTTLNVYVDGELHKAIDLTSKYAWLYGAEASPGNSPGEGDPRHIYDEAQLTLDETVPAGSTVKLQKDADNSSEYAIDFVGFEEAEEVANPDPDAYAVPGGFTHQDVQDALDEVRMDTTGKLVGVYLPAGDYETSSKFQVYGGAVEVVGAGPWFTRFHAPDGQENTDIGFRADATAQGSSFTDFAYFGNYTSRIDGPGKVFDFAYVSDITIDNIWNEHMVCLYWGANTDNITIKNSRIRNMFADGINMTNGSTDNLVSNNEARATGDDSFALFSAIDAGGADMKNNVYENLTSILTWRAAGLAVYGGYDNTFSNIRIADTLVYSGITVSSLDFGYPMNGFGPGPTTLEDISIERAGGHFWNGQTFPGIWMFSASKVFQNIRVTGVDIVDPTYSGIMFQTNYVGGQAQFPVADTVLTDVSITGAKKSGDEYDDKSGFGLWANEMPEPGQGPAVGDVTFRNLRMSGNAEDIRNTTDTFTINVEE
ncbi:Chitinase A1 precursor [Streptomyces sp. YIM 130001]|uniref:discoidin domain-containing protein n=1 Tax=Streptomyces sp. YIM 130001 TaxID=2259644 RepID=UPI000E653E50|nr:discoidin domain-containing protein [Streptomyces sp. YIM 130001]RII17789.1 Chitinase A1 precursor [Streptomyces sp. YIM 130001]